MKAWIWNILISLDQLANVVFAPIFNWVFPTHPEHLFGKPDETISSVFHKNSDRCRACYWFCRFFNIFDKDHCKESVEWDE